MKAIEKARRAVRGKKPTKPKTEPLWKGPEVDGITQSLLNGYLNCRERFRLLVVEGLSEAEGFNHRLEYGSMWHACEEGLALGEDYRKYLMNYCRQLALQYPMDRQQITKWYEICRRQFPVYVEYWQKHPDVKDRRNVEAEVNFRTPYELPSGRTVLLRGKRDAVDVIGKGRKAGIYLQENKTKGEINETQLRDQLFFNLQTGFYLTALKIEMPDTKVPIRGVRYNVVRRPLAGGRHSISQSKGAKGSKCGRKSCRETPDPACDNCRGVGRVGMTPPETNQAFYDRLANEHIAVDPAFFFMRWNIDIPEPYLERYRNEFLHPALENLCDWWEWVSYCHAGGFSPFDYQHRQESFPEHLDRHYRLPYGIWNPLAEGRSSLYDEYLENGSMTGLRRIDTLFPELEGAI